MQSGLILLAAIVMVVSLAIPFYAVVMCIRALIVRSGYPAWPMLVVLLIWLAQWPLFFILAFTLPGAGSIAGDGHESPAFDFLMLALLCAYNAGPFYWVLRHRARYVRGD